MITVPYSLQLMAHGHYFPGYFLQLTHLRQRSRPVATHVTRLRTQVSARLTLRLTPVARPQTPQPTHAPTAAQVCAARHAPRGTQSRCAVYDLTYDVDDHCASHEKTKRTFRGIPGPSGSQRSPRPHTFTRHRGSFCRRSCTFQLLVFHVYPRVASTALPCT